MGLYRFLLFFLLIPSLSLADNLAETQCREVYRDLLQSCEQFNVTTEAERLLGYDRISVESVFSEDQLFQSHHVLLDAHRCQQNPRYQSYKLAYTPRTQQGHELCATLRFFRDTRGVERVEERIYQDDLLTHIRLLTEEQWRVETGLDLPPQDAAAAEASSPRARAQPASNQ